MPAEVKVLVTGSAGFIGRNLVARLRADVSLGPTEVLEFDRETNADRLDEYAALADFIFHLAGVNRPVDPAEFTEGNVDLTTRLLETLRSSGPKPVLLSSSAQASLENPYGESKRYAEEAVARYAAETGAEVFIYRLPGVFGKWSRPNYNSVVATFCHNVARDLPIQVNDSGAVLPLVYIDDVVDEFIAALKGAAARVDGLRCSVPVVHEVALRRIAELLHDFRAHHETLAVPDSSDAFQRKLYATYLSYLPEDGFSYPLAMHTDERGSFTEIIRTPDRGQFSVNVIRPGITKGNHWHDTKNEKFLVVSGHGVIRLRRIDGEDAIAYPVSEEELRVVDIPPGYTHNIENLGLTDMVVFMWASEAFDYEKPDTYASDV